MDVHMDVHEIACGKFTGALVMVQHTSMRSNALHTQCHACSHAASCLTPLTYHDDLQGMSVVRPPAVQLINNSQAYLLVILFVHLLKFYHSLIFNIG